MYRNIPYFIGKSMVSCRFSLQLIHWLDGGLEHYIFFYILGIIILIVFHIVQRGSNHQPEHIFWLSRFFEAHVRWWCQMTFHFGTGWDHQQGRSCFSNFWKASLPRCGLILARPISPLDLYGACIWVWRCLKPLGDYRNGWVFDLPRVCRGICRSLYTREDLDLKNLYDPPGCTLGEWGGRTPLKKIENSSTYENKMGSDPCILLCGCIWFLEGPPHQIK